MIYKSTVYRKNGQAIYLEYDMDKFSIQHVYYLTTILTILLGTVISLIIILSNLIIIFL